MSKQTKKKAEDDDPLAGDLSGLVGNLKWKKASFVFAPKDTTVTIRMPKGVVDMAKKVAKKQGVKYHRMMRDVIVDYVVKAA